MNTEAHAELDQRVQEALVGIYGEYDFDLANGKTCRRLAEDLRGRYDNVRPAFTKAIDNVVASSKLDSPTRLGVLIESLKRLGFKEREQQFAAAVQSITATTL